MSGKVLTLILVFCALIAGGALYYTQVYAFYDYVALQGEGGTEEIRITTESGAEIALPVGSFEGIDSQSSPIRFRACFEADLPADIALASHEGPVPNVAPGWFDCFDANQIGADLEAGSAMAYLGQENIIYGVDRVLAIYPDGRAYAWHQINHCGEKVFDGEPAPSDCPPPPEGNS